MKKIFFIYFNLSIFAVQGLYAQKASKYDIEVTDKIDKKQDTSYKSSEYCPIDYYITSGYYVPCKDTCFAIHIEYKYGEEVYEQYYDPRTHRREVPNFGTTNLPIDTAWLEKNVRHLCVYFRGQYNGYLQENNTIDSINFIKEWALFERFLRRHKNIKTIHLTLSSDLITQYLGRDFYLPAAITQLKKLRNLRISTDSWTYNKTVTMPPEILRIKHLEELSLRSSEVYMGLEQLRGHKIKCLRLTNCIAAESFPLWLYDLPDLKILDFNFSVIKPDDKTEVPITTLPDGISKLKKLRTLVLGPYYELSHLPVEELCKMKKLGYLVVISPSFFANKVQITQLKNCFKEYKFQKDY